MWLRNATEIDGESNSCVTEKGSRDDANNIIEKVYVSGSMNEAEHECAMGRLAAGPGVARYRQAITETHSNRPAVVMEFAEGQNLDLFVADRGSIAAINAIRIVASVARTLARLHGLKNSHLPNGMCHGDVKPQNILVMDEDTLLIDFEHARPISSSSNESFTGGTSAYSPPEAHLGQPPTTAFDVFGLGATLSFMLDGGVARRVPRQPEVNALVLDCCALEPRQRPAAIEVAERAERLIHILDEDPAEQSLDDWATGACLQPPTEVIDARSSVWRLRKKLLQRLPDLLNTPNELITRRLQDNDQIKPETLQHELDLILRLLDRFPRNRQLLAGRKQLLNDVKQQLQNAAAIVSKFNKAEQFQAGLHWLRTTTALVNSAFSIAGGLSHVTMIEPGESPGPSQRAPIEFLRLLSKQTAVAQQEIQERVNEISEAEKAFDFTQAEQIIDALATDYGGSSATVAERRDQLHRLGFYIERIARSETKVERIGSLWDPAAVEPLKNLVAQAVEAVTMRSRREVSGSGAVGLRGLQVTLTNIAEEFPHLTQIPPALQALSQTLNHLTNEAWQQLRTAEERLSIVPVPVRPLQLALGRLDTYRLLEAFVDHDDGSRSELIDRIERLRLKLEQARSARDQLAENAENALARGHWTTGLFEMERVVERLNPEDDSERPEADRMLAQLQAARRTKQEIEKAVCRNVELAASYASLDDDPFSTFEARLRVLQERRDCLMFLGLHVSNERASLYRSDLRSTETQIAMERAADAEQRLNTETDPLQQLRIARSTFDTLSGAKSSSDVGIEQSGRIMRLQEHWSKLAMQCQRSIDAQKQQEQQKQQQRKRLLAITIFAAIATTTAIGFALKPWLIGKPAQASEKTK